MVVTVSIEERGRMMDQSTIETLARRLDRVERENRWLKRAGVVALAVIAAVVLMGQATESKVVKVIEAEKFVLRDGQGRQRAELFAHKDVSGLAFSDQKGRVRIVMGVDKDSQTFHLMNENQIPRVSIGLDEKGSTLLMWDSHQKLRLGLGVTILGPALALSDKAENHRVELTVLLDSPELSVTDKTGKTIWSAP